MIPISIIIRAFPWDNFSSALNVPVDVVARAHGEMLEDVQISTTEGYKSVHPNNPIGND